MAPAPSRFRSVAARLAVPACVLVLLAALVVYAVPAVTPVPAPVGLAVAALALSLPVLAAALAYGLRGAPLGLPGEGDRFAARAAGVLVALFAGSFAATTLPAVPRLVGDALYLVASVALLYLAAAVVTTERSGPP